MEKNNELVSFEGKEIRKTWHDEQWHFSVVDIIEVLTDSPKPKRYWTDLKRRSEKESGQGYAFCVPLKLTASDGRKRLTDCANKEGILRIVMSVPSHKAEPLKLWLAQVGAERIQETENPELTFERMAEIYRTKGRTDEWIRERMQSITTRKQLTDEWKMRGVKEGHEYGILTATIAKGTFGLTPSEHSQFKGLERQNLRDHMTPMELILTSLSEEVTKTLTVEHNANGFNESLDAAAKGGEVAGKARRNVEEATGKKVVSPDNFLKQIEDTQKVAKLPEDDKTKPNKL
jgi:DNA-damage-inducible protein D